MTDGRIPGKWISEPRFAEMSVDAWCIFTKAIAWSNEAGTDGLVKRRYLSQLHPSGEVHPRANEEIASLGLWVPASDGYQFLNWNKKAHQGGLGQELAAVVKQGKERAKKNQQAYRDRIKANSASSTPVTGDVIANVTADVGQDRTGQAFDIEVPFQENLNKETGELLEPEQPALKPDPWANVPPKKDIAPEKTHPASFQQISVATESNGPTIEQFMGMNFGSAS